MEQQSTAEYGQARYGVALYGRVQGRKQRLDANSIRAWEKPAPVRKTTS